PKPKTTYTSNMAPSATTPSAPPPSLPELLNTITAAISDTNSTLPAANSYLPPPNGLSLLDLKNEAMLAYLQNLVFLLIVRLRGGSLTSKPGDDTVAKL